jgi:sigma-54 dependent transcriptional regulator, acetoin dehydrogenase operon transcriptional activator AcoR
MHNALNYPDLGDEWRRFIHEGIKPTGIRKVIGESWNRCRSLQMDPYEMPPVLDRATLSNLLVQKSYLLSVVRPILKDFYSYINGTGFIAGLTDENGIVIELKSEINISEKGLESNYTMGAHRSEQKAGTNAIGLAILEGEPIQAVGYEHYNAHFHSWTCSAAPIRDTKGKIIGTFVISGDQTLNHEHTLGMVVSMVRVIEREIHLQENNLAKNQAIDNKVELFQFDHIIGSSPSINHAIHIAKKVSETNTRVLLDGESGTGKELFAQAIHNASRRKNGPFIAVNCSAIPNELMESELFGYSDGAFTGSKKGGKPGKFELANGGTIFLDEVNSMPLEMQAKLLRVLQGNEVSRIGATKSTSIDARVIAATNEPLESLIEKGRFRSDLFYRLGVVIINIPPLRERIDDLPILAKHLLRKICSKLGKQINQLDERLITALGSYSWPGNVRELENYIERAVILAQDSFLSIELFPQKMLTVCNALPSKKNLKPLDRVERESIIIALELFEGNISKASRILGVSRNTLYNKIKFYNIDYDKKVLSKYAK